MRVGVSRARPRLSPGANGAGASQPIPEAATIRRTSAKPLECTPALASPSTGSPGATPRGSKVPRSAAPTAKPARS